jgi:hypothetical protein
MASEQEVVVLPVRDYLLPMADVFSAQTCLHHPSRLVVRHECAFMLQRQWETCRKIST